MQSVPRSGSGMYTSELKRIGEQQGGRAALGQRTLPEQHKALEGAGGVGSHHANLTTLQGQASCLCRGRGVVDPPFVGATERYLKAKFWPVRVQRLQGGTQVPLGDLGRPQHLKEDGAGPRCRCGNGQASEAAVVVDGDEVAGMGPHGRDRGREAGRGEDPNAQ